jgi:hypothetical protein
MRLKVVEERVESSRTDGQIIVPVCVALAADLVFTKLFGIGFVA